MEAFDRIYFDTSTLRAGRWPQATGISEDVFRLSRILGIALFLPSPGGAELETLWLRELFKLRNEGEISKHVAGIIEGIISPLQWDSVRDKYRATVWSVKERWDIRSVPTSSLPLADAFQLTLAADPSVDNKRPGLRDAVIYHSVIDHLREDPAHLAVLVAEDKGFGLMLDRQERARLDALGVRLAVVQPREKTTALNILRQNLHAMNQARETAAERAKREAQEARARRALERQRDELEAFLKSALQYPVFAFGMGIQEVFGMEVGEIVRVTVSHPESAMLEEPTTILAEVQVALHVLAYPISLPPLYRSVGEEEQPVKPWVPAAGSAPYDGEGIAIVEARAVQDGDEYRIVEFVSAMFRR